MNAVSYNPILESSQPDLRYLLNYGTIDVTREPDTHKIKVNRLNLGKMAERVASVWAWEFWGKHNVFKQPTLPNKKRGDIAVRIGSKIWIYDFTTNEKTCFEKIKKYRGKYGIIVLVFGDDYDFPEGRSKGSDVQIYGMKNYADSVGAKFRLEANQLREIDDLVMDSKEEIINCEIYKKTKLYNKKHGILTLEENWGIAEEQKLEKFNDLAQQFDQLKPQYDEIKGGQGDATWRLSGTQTSINDFLRKTRSLSFS